MLNLISPALFLIPFFNILPSFFSDLLACGVCYIHSVLCICVCVCACAFVYFSLTNSGHPSKLLKPLSHLIKSQGRVELLSEMLSVYELHENR